MKYLCAVALMLAPISAHAQAASADELSHEAVQRIIMLNLQYNALLKANSDLQVQLSQAKQQIETLKKAAIPAPATTPHPPIPQPPPKKN